MKISELPKEIRKKALKYQKLDGQDLETDVLSLAFNWHSTKEGRDYWYNLHRPEPPKELKDTIVESVINQFKQRSEVGINKYGVTLDRTDLSTLEWLQHAQEEAMDFCLYLEKLKKEYKDDKLINQLFIGKVSQILGYDKTTELLKESKNTFKNETK